MALVIKEWWADFSPNSKGKFVLIKAREEGLLAFIFSFFGIDPTTELTVTERNFIFECGSLAGFSRKTIPIKNVSSIVYGYFKPWLPALILGLAFAPSTLGLSVIGALIWYWVSKEMTLAVFEMGGISNGITFRPSIIEGKEINENECWKIVQIISGLVDRVPKQESKIEPLPFLPKNPAKEIQYEKTPENSNLQNRPLSRKCPRCGEINEGDGKFCESCGQVLTK